MGYGRCPANSNARGEFPEAFLARWRVQGFVRLAVACDPAALRMTTIDLLEVRVEASGKCMDPSSSKPRPPKEDKEWGSGEKLQIPHFIRDDNY